MVLILTLQVRCPQIIYRKLLKDLQRNIKRFTESIQQFKEILEHRQKLHN